MRKKIAILFLLLSSCFLFTNGQDTNTESDPKETKHKGNKMWNLDVTGNIDFPAGDMAKRYGTSYRIGPSVKYKTKSNWIFGASFEFIVGNKFREDSLIWNVKSQQGGIISNQGDLLNIGAFLRGYKCGIMFGKILPILAANPNSGLTTLSGIGFMQHRINFFDRDNAIPHFREEYEKGYDRLTNGAYISEFLGYSYYSKNKAINFYAGFEAVWGLTRGRRDYTFDLQRADNASRNDILLGFKLGWVLPIYRKNVEETYY